MSPDVFNWVALVAAIAIGVAAGWVSRRMLVAGRGEWRAIAAAAAIGAALTGVASIAVAVLSFGDFFAATHLAYLVVAVGVPVTSLFVLTLRSPITRWLRGLAVVLLLPIPVGIYATHVEPFWLRTERVTVPSDAIAGEPIRIGVLSDLQTTGIGEYERAAVDRLLAEQPDVVLIPGDLYQVEGREELDRAGPDFTALLEQLGRTVPHVLAVSGNTDSVAGLRRLATDTGVLVLDNEAVDLSVNGTNVRVLGITLDGDELRLAGAVEGLRRPEDAGAPSLSIVLAHQPDEAFRFTGASGPDLLVAGHTHGGQIAIPGFGPLVTLSSAPRSVAAGGLGTINDFPVYVSTGVGRERGYAPQIRLGVRPSVGIIDVVGPLR